MQEKRIITTKTNDVKRLINLIWSCIKILFGIKEVEKPYLLNRNTNEIHDLNNPHKNCHVELMTNKEYISEKKAARLVRKGKADGCRFCLKKWHTE